MSRRVSSLITALILLLTLLVGAPLAHGAVPEAIVFNNVSASAALNATPDAVGDVDDLSVAPGGTLFLPASADPAALAGWFVGADGAKEAFTPEDYTLTETSIAGSWRVAFERDDVPAVTVHQSARVPAMFITTGQGLAAIEADKDFKDEDAIMAMVDPAATTTYHQPLDEMKGRGNSTWDFPKKPYQIKLEGSAELVPAAGAHKTWLLLANYLDASQIRNHVAFDLEGAMQRRVGATDHAIKGRSIDLFIDGGYRGTYSLTEKVQVGKQRVPITDLEGPNEDANPDLGDLDPVVVKKPSQVRGLLEAGYVPFTNTPSGYRQGGYLLELDFATQAREETSYVITRHGLPVVLKGPEDANAAEVFFVGSRLQELEDAIYSWTGRNALGKHFSEYIDVNSWARHYAYQELLANDDAYKSSTFVYMDKGGRLVAGPFWDGDRTLGALRARPAADAIHVAPPPPPKPPWMRARRGPTPKPQWIRELLAHTTFRTAVKKAYAEVVGPEVEALLAPHGRLATLAADVDRSAALDKLRWAPNRDNVRFDTPAQDVAHLRSYITTRHAFLKRLFGGDFTSGALLRDGYYTINNGAVAVDIDGGSFAPQANAQLWRPNGSGAQTYRLVRGSDMLYTITNVNSGLALEVQGGKAADWANVWQNTPNGSLTQKWRVMTFDGRTYTIASAYGMTPVHDRAGIENGFVLDVRAASQANGANLQMYSPNWSAAQRFTFDAVSLPTPSSGGTYVWASALDQSKVLDVQWASPDNGANVQIWDRNDTKAQRFRLVDVGRGRSELWTGAAPASVLDVAYAGTANGTNVWQYAHNGSSAQRWTLRPSGYLDGSMYLVSVTNGKYLDVAWAATANGTNVRVWEGTGTGAQRFIPKPVG